MSQPVSLLADASKSVLGTKYQTLQKWRNGTVLKEERKHMPQDWGFPGLLLNGIWKIVDNKAGQKQLMSVFQSSNNFKHMGLEKDFTFSQE